MEILIRQFKDVFNTEGGNKVLEHLAKVACLNKSLPTKEVNEVFIYEGRRQIIYEIYKFLDLTETEIDNIRKAQKRRKGSL